MTRSAPTKRLRPPGWPPACPRAASSCCPRKTISGPPAPPGRAVPAPNFITTSARRPAAAGPTAGPGCDCDRFVEFWNLVFMQYDRDEAGALTPSAQAERRHRHGPGAHHRGHGRQTERLRNRRLPAAHRPRLRRKPGSSTAPAKRPTAPSACWPTTAGRPAFLIADGVFAGNEGRGYVLRRVMRRAIQAASVLEIEAPFLKELCDRVIEIMGANYPELREQQPLIEEMAVRGRKEIRHDPAAGQRHPHGRDRVRQVARRAQDRRRSRLSACMTRTVSPST